MPALTPLMALNDLKWSVAALADVAAEPGMAKGEVVQLASIGIKRKLDWVIATLEAAGEGKKNMGITTY